MSSIRYRFRLARLLSLRQRREQDAATELAAARAAEDLLRDASSSVSAQQANAREAAMPAPGQTRSVGDLRNNAFLAEQLGAGSIAAAERVRVAERETAGRMITLVDRVRDRRILERLRERQLAEWQVNAVRHDRDTMDAVAQHRDRNRDTPHPPHPPAAA